MFACFHKCLIRSEVIAPLGHKMENAYTIKVFRDLLSNFNIQRNLKVCSNKIK